MNSKSYQRMKAEEVEKKEIKIVMESLKCSCMIGDEASEVL